jgi:uncharacterized protein YndB with AHSA1/START domain
MSPEATEQAVVRLQRTIPAPPDQVYRAWLDPELMRRWFAATGMHVTRAEVDERVGGHHRVWQAGPDGDAGGFESELLELVPGERIVFAWGFVGPERVADPAHASRLTITLRPAPGDATELTLVHERLGALDRAMPGMLEMVGNGWGQALDKLVAALDEG